ncbi:MAG: phosphoribosylformylglycinamidine synthase I [Legionella sp.]|nr:phosphoribosylformylglycinamidine synthase I [Legionella sp.]
MIRIGLIQFPGSNCERETILAIKRAGMEAVEFLWNEPLNKLANLDGYVMVGGFSYEDRSRAGIIAALDPVMDEIKKQSATGKPVLGICNGAQILLEAGMLPGLENHRVSMALTENKRILNEKIVGVGFYNAWVNIRLTQNHQHNAFTHGLKTDDIIHLPIAHAEGRFVMPESLLDELEKQGLNLFLYCDENGNVINDFPTNPNGSIANIAAISNKAGNVLAMMPHPERTPNGDVIFKSMREYIAHKSQKTAPTPQLLAPFTKPPCFVSKQGSHQCLIKLIITDNHALTVQKTLQKLGFPVTVNRFVHWEINGSDEDLARIKKSGVLYSERKEREINLSELTHKSALAYLVRPKDNIMGQKTLQTLEKHFSIKHLNTIQYSVLWQFVSEDADINELITKILQTNIIGNPYAHECYEYVHQLFQ